MRLVPRLTAVLAGVIGLGLLAPAGASGVTNIPQSPQAAWAPYKSCPGAPHDNCASVRAMLKTANGIFLAGDFTALHSPDGKKSRPAGNLALVSMAGAPVTSFATHSFNGMIQSLVSDGSTLFVAGAFTKVDGKAVGHIARFSLTTGAHVAFTSEVDGTVNTMALQGPGLYIGGNFHHVQGLARESLAALNSSTGAVYSFFNASATISHTDPSPNDYPKHNKVPIRKIIATPTRVYVTGDADSIDGAARPAIAALNALNGALDNSFQPTPLITTEVQGLDMALVPASPGNAAGLVVAGGGLYNVSFRLGLDGSLVWAVDGDGDFQAVTVLDGVVYFGGHFVCIAPYHASCYEEGKPGSVTRMHIAAFPYNGSGVLSPLTSFVPWLGPNKGVYFFGVWSLINDGTSLFAGGDWQSIKVGSTTYAQSKYARFGPAA